jgi:hypothetical protein
MPKILLSTTMRWPTAARLAGAFAQSGCAVDAIAPAGHPLDVSRYPTRRFRYRALAPLRTLHAAIADSKPDLIVPCDDRALAHLLALQHGEFAGLVARSLGAPQHYAQLTGRAGFLAAARDAGVAVPDTIAVEDKSTFEFALAMMGLPAVLKTDGSWGGDGVAILRRSDTARDAWRRFTHPTSRIKSTMRALRSGDAHHLLAALKTAPARISLQRHVWGTPATTSMACWQGEVVAAHHFDVLTADGERGPASVIKRVNDAAMDDAGRKLARRFGLSGLHGLDYMRDADGRVNLIEINPRATQTSHLALEQDLCAALAACVTGTTALPRPTATARDIIALFPRELPRDAAGPWPGAAYHDVPHDDARMRDAYLGPFKPTASRGPAHAAAILNET